MLLLFQLMLSAKKTDAQKICRYRPPRHSTSISLEPEFMEELEAIARQKGLSVNQLVTEIDSKREHENLSSAIRIYILNHLKKTNPGN